MVAIIGTRRAAVAARPNAAPAVSAELKARVARNVAAALSDPAPRVKAKQIQAPPPAQLKGLASVSVDYGIGMQDSGTARAYIDPKAKKVYVRETYVERLPWENITSKSTNWFVFDLAKLNRR